MNDRDPFEEAFSNAYSDLMSTRQECQEVRRGRQDQVTMCAKCLICAICKRELALSREQIFLECLNARRARNEQNLCSHCGNRHECAILTTNDPLEPEI